MREMIFIAVSFVAAGVAAGLFVSRHAGRETVHHVQTADPERDLPADTGPDLSGYFGKDEVRIRVSGDSHYYVDAEINFRQFRFLVDTGATHMVLRESDAYEAGVYLSRADYRHPVRTANGEAMAALVSVDEVEVGTLRVRNVPSLVMKDEQLSVNLLGMSFLSRIESIRTGDGEMILR